MRVSPVFSGRTVPVNRVMTTDTATIKIIRSATAPIRFLPMVSILPGKLLQLICNKRMVAQFLSPVKPFRCPPEKKTFHSHRSLL